MKNDNIFSDMLLFITDEKGNKEYDLLDIYHFKTLPNDSPILVYTSLIFNNLFHKDPRFHIERENFELFLLKNEIVNAFALSKGQNNIIGIHLELLNILEKGISEACQNLDRIIVEIFAQENKLPNIEGLIFRFITLFISFHELGHLIQGRNSDKYLELKKERYNIDNYPKYSEEDHLMEIDADLFAAQNLTNFIIHNWIQFSPQLKSVVTIDTLIALGTASIFLLFFELCAKAWPPMYFYASSHPHPFIRISYIVDLMNKHTIDYFKMDDSKYEFQLLNTLMTASSLINTDKRINIKGYEVQYRNSIIQIASYIKNLSHAKGKYPCLIQNFN